MVECTELGLFNTRVPRFSQLFFYDFEEAEIYDRAEQSNGPSCSSRAAQSYIRSGKRLYSKCGISEIWFNCVENNENLSNNKGLHQPPTKSSSCLHLEPAHVSTLPTTFGWETRQSGEEPGVSQENIYQGSEGSPSQGGDPVGVAMKLEEVEGATEGIEDIEGSVRSESEESEVGDVEMSAKSERSESEESGVEDVEMPVKSEREGEVIEGFSEPEFKEREMESVDGTGTRDEDEEFYFPSDDMTSSYKQELSCVLDSYDVTVTD